MERVAIVGAGIQGVCVALELARRGYDIDVFDKEADILLRASLWNEGKIHLGYLYANDPTLRTARMMISGSLQFAQLIERWTSLPASQLHVSMPFKYVVPVESLLEPTVIERHFAQVGRFIKEAVDENGHLYLGRELPQELFRRLNRSELKNELCLASTAAAYQTFETSVDTAQVRAALKLAVDARSRIRFFARKSVVSVTRVNNGKFRIHTQDQADDLKDYDYVVNSSWEYRLRMDTDPWLAPHDAETGRDALEGKPEMIRFHF